MNYRIIIEDFKKAITNYKQIIINKDSIIANKDNIINNQNSEIALLRNTVYKNKIDSLNRKAQRDSNEIRSKENEEKLNQLIIKVNQLSKTVENIKI